MSNKKYVEKPWGHEEIWANTKNYVGKILYINKKSRLSLQYHVKKEETIRVISGTLFLHYEDKSMGIKEEVLKSGDSIHIPPMTIHRFEARDEPVILVEVSTIELDDVVRVEDDYNRK